MAEEKIIGEHRYRHEVLLTCTTGPHLDLGEKRLKTLDHHLAIDQLFTMAAGVEGIPMLKRKFFGFALGLGLFA
jgi:hypothetical protein